ncbi:hypothetical protein EVAR_62798_1 [Eumeta japonica]|uniref:Uncharacterized protein n=1 Tax=Eumeta variegata TaxID=151549 RepID=A0A4C1ZIL2_EUMVA|nr:hypothetical protein EVAR_62798_1 [Eumeta japonica]
MSNTDESRFDLKFKKLPTGTVEGREVPSKRQVLIFVMSIFDPLCLLSPYTKKGKMMLLRSWRAGVPWRVRSSERDVQTWLEWYSVTQVRRRTKSSHTGEKYLHTNGLIDTALVAGKACVAPNKLASIPRLELQVALLSYRLASSIIKEYDSIKNPRRIIWIGAAFSKTPEREWPVHKDIGQNDEPGDELKHETVCVITQPDKVSDVHRFSSWTRLRPLPATSRLRALDSVLIDGVLRVADGGPLSRLSWPWKLREHGKPAARAILADTITPYRQKGSHSRQLRRVRHIQPHPSKKDYMPLARLEGNQPPFTHCDMGYFGPTEVTIGRRRGKR